MVLGLAALVSVTFCSSSKRLFEGMSPSSMVSSHADSVFVVEHFLVEQCVATQKLQRVSGLIIPFVLRVFGSITFSVATVRELSKQTFAGTE